MKKCQYDRIYEQTKDFGRAQFVKELQLQINENKDLKKHLETVHRRLCHLLKSKTISLYDEIDFNTKKYKYDIKEFDSLYSKIYKPEENNITMTITLNDDQVNDINNKILEVKNEYESKINNTIDYVKDCLEHLCTVDEIEILNKLGYNSNTEE